MRFVVGIVIAAGLLVAGCSPSANSTNGSGGPPGEISTGGGPPATGETPAETVELTPVPIESGVVTLSPEDTTIQFVGTHAGGDPNPRTGGFEQFSGTLQVDAAAKTLQAVSVEIEANSLWTPIPNLTEHLKNPDFLEVREFPTIEFQSTQVDAIDASESYISGNLTLHGVTKEISFPGEVTFSDEGLTLHAQFAIDRTQYGMGLLLDRVEKNVTLEVWVGRKTAPQTQAGPGGFSGGRGGPGGGFDPAQFFAQRDANQDGKLTGDEISDRMRENFAEIDTDGDEAVSLEEFQARMQRFGRGGGGGGRGGGGGGEGGGPERPPRPQRPDSQ